MEPPAAYRLERVGVLMEGRDGDPHEAWGVLNPASARGPDGELYLFPRMVAAGNYSRIGKARVCFDDAGTPVRVERLGVALEPAEEWERNARTAGTEDPRITWVPRLDAHVMTYTAYGPLRARIGLAWSHDLERWQRLGPAWFSYDPALGTDLNLYPNKDAVLFPEPITAPDGRLAYAMLHRPLWDLSEVRDSERMTPPPALEDPRPGIWVSFAPADEVEADPVAALPRFSQHRQVALPEQPWEVLKIGGGTPPVRAAEGWLTVYHGVSGRLIKGQDLQPHVRYAAGITVHDADDVTRLVYRSTTPVLAPELRAERVGIVPNVVFPTAIDVADGAAHVFYGMADSRIGVARLTPTPAPG